MWKNLRIALLLLVLAAVALQAWRDRTTTRGWHDTLWVGIYPLNADGSAQARDYIGGLVPADFGDIEQFLSREAHRYGVALAEPVHIELYPPGAELPPALAPDAGMLGAAWWSLKLRWFAAHAPRIDGRPPPRIRLFVLYHDPATLTQVPDSHGLQKGLVGVIHAFASRAMTGTNNIVIAHEFLHTVGASDKYDPGSGAPLYPAGFADPEQQPRWPQQRAEIMAGRMAVSEQEWRMPDNLSSVVVGPDTAREIGWVRP
ncbi:MAG: hypothetical protein JSR67_17160 [Proteobacteria bacterium]|nr:hypothetical protein [Pseudomonadota bacterium]